MPSSETITLSLTGDASHAVVREPGVGGLTIGPANRGGPPPDVIVGADDTIDWSAFDALTVPAGYPWPRSLHYHGNDTGFLAWSRRRPIESFEWTPVSAVTVDASHARIMHLTVNLRSAPTDIVVPRSVDGWGDDLTFAGDLSLLTVALAAGAACPARLGFAPRTRPARDAEPVRLPQLTSMACAGAISVFVEPLRQPFDCASLRQFRRARRLTLNGRLTEPAALAHLTELTGLELRNCPDLSGLPPLTSWPELDHVVGWNIDDVAGRRLRTEIRNLTKTTGRRWEHASVTKLRRPQWFTTQYSLPFSGWPSDAARAAVKAYRAAETRIAASTAPAAVEDAIRIFTRSINALPAIETSEREDAGEAVRQLAAGAPIVIEIDLAQSWFDAERHF